MSIHRPGGFFWRDSPGSKNVVNLMVRTGCRITPFIFVVRLKNQIRPSKLSKKCLIFGIGNDWIWGGKHHTMYGSKNTQVSTTRKAPEKCAWKTIRPPFFLDLVDSFQGQPLMKLQGYHWYHWIFVWRPLPSSCHGHSQGPLFFQRASSQGQHWCNAHSIDHLFVVGYNLRYDVQHPKKNVSKN